MVLEITGATRSIRAIPAHDAFDAMRIAGWTLLLYYDGANTHWVRGPNHCVLMLNSLWGLAYMADKPFGYGLMVIATQYAPVDVMGGRLADLDRIHLADVAHKAKGAT